MHSEFLGLQQKANLACSYGLPDCVLHNACGRLEIRTGLMHWGGLLTCLGGLCYLPLVHFA